MGYFLSVSAFQGTEAGAVRDAIAAYAGAHDVAVVRADGRRDDHHDLDLFAGDWTVVLWPEHFNVHDVPACAWLSRELGTLVSAIHTFDGDYWAHNVFRDGEHLDRFASMPDYFTDTDAGRWAGDPARVAALFGRPVQEVAPYYVHQSVHAEEPAGKAFSDDEFALDDMWVFADLWRRLGIAYPEDMGATAARLRLAERWADRLPADPDGDGL